jgi:hypothetical protein
MNRIKRSFLGLFAALVWLFASGGASAATQCSGVMSGTIADGVVVYGGFCQLQGAHVTGGVHVMGGFVMICASTINGGLTSDGAGELIVGAEEANCDGNVFNGAVRISNTGTGLILPAPSIALERSTFNGAVVLMGNQGQIAVSEARISGGLFCSNNAFNLMNEGNQNLISGKITCKFQ